MISCKIFYRQLFLTIAFSLLSCGGKTSLFLENSCKIKKEHLNSSNITHEEALCTFYFYKKSLQAKVSISLKNNITKVIMIDELGVPLLVTSDSLNQLNLIRRFPPFTEENARLAGLFINSLLRSERVVQKASENCKYLKDLSNLTEAVYYHNSKEEKDLTKIVHNNDIFNIRHLVKKEIFELVDSKNKIVARYVKNSNHWSKDGDN